MASFSRRHFLQAAGSAAAGLGMGTGVLLHGAEAQAALDPLVARPPQGFTPLSLPGRIVKVEKGGDFASMMQPNQLWPKPEVAKALLEKAMTAFTGAPNLAESLKKFIAPQESVAIKINGIAGQTGYTMAVNFELILPVVEGLIEAGVKPENIMLYEQYYLTGCRVTVKGYKLPDGVKAQNHMNATHPMPDVMVYNGLKTRYCKQFMDASAVIDMTMIKDHSICGYTGTLKNITHGTINNPQDHHGTGCNPQIAMLYNHPIVRSRVRLHITDAFKITYDKGPLDRDPKTRIPHGAVYVATDPVAMDLYGWNLIDKERRARGLKTLAESRREPRYIHVAGELGLGVRELSEVKLRSYTV